VQLCVTIYSLGLLNISREKPVFVVKKINVSSQREWSKKSSSKAAAILMRGAYVEYVSTAKWRERRWWLFSTFPYSIRSMKGKKDHVFINW